MAAGGILQGKAGQVSPAGEPGRWNWILTGSHIPRGHRSFGKKKTQMGCCIRGCNSSSRGRLTFKEPLEGEGGWLRTKPTAGEDESRVSVFSETPHPNPVNRLRSSSNRGQMLREINSAKEVKEHNQADCYLWQRDSTPKGRSRHPNAEFTV